MFSLIQGLFMLVLKYLRFSRSFCNCFLIWSHCGQITSDQISRSVVSDSLQPHEPQHARPPCPSPTPRVHSDSRPSSQWCHPAISSAVVPFSSCPQSLPASVQHTLNISITVWTPTFIILSIYLISSIISWSTWFNTTFCDEGNNLYLFSSI